MNRLLERPTRPDAGTRPLDACRHCGQPCTGLPVRTAGGVFCCRGCEAVYLLLQSHGLDAYYACPLPPGVSQRATTSRPGDRFAALDDPSLVVHLTAAIGDDLRRATLPAPDMHCASCLWLLERLWRVDAGVVRSEANLTQRTVTVDFHPSRTSLRRIAERLAALGYEPVITAEVADARAARTRRMLYRRLGVAGFAFGNVMLFSIPRYANGAPLPPSFQLMFDLLNVALALPVLLFSASEFFRGAWRAVRARGVTLDVPIALGLVALFGRSLFEIATRSGEGFLDSFCGLVFFLLIGRLFQHKAFERLDFDRTARSFLPLSVIVERGDATSSVSVDRLHTGDVVVLRGSEVVPADAVLVDDEGEIDYAFVTGEQAPVAAHRGDIVRAGGRVVGRTLRLMLTRPVAQSALARLWTHPIFSVPKRLWLDEVLARFGWWFTVTALGVAAVGAAAWWPDGRQALNVATAVLIIACPCAFTLAAPLTLGTAMGRLGVAGVFVKNPAVVLDLSRVTAVAFDKTGTLTVGTRETELHTDAMSAASLTLIRRLAAQSAHPVSRAIAGEVTGGDGVTDVVEVPHRGLRGTVDGHAVAIGSASFISAVTAHVVPPIAGVTWAAIDGGRPRWLQTTTPERPGVEEVVRGISGNRETWLLSGDHDGEARRWRQVFGDHMRFRQTPEDKLDAVRDLQRRGHRVLMIGDGLNDAGAFAAADVGLAISDSTASLVPACDAIAGGAVLKHLNALLDYATRARRVIVLCFAVSLFYNAIGLWLALTGVLTPLATAIFMPISSLTIVGLSTGLMRRGPQCEARA